MLLKCTAQINVFLEFCRTLEGEFSHFLDNPVTLIFPDVFGHLTILDNTEPIR